MATMLRNTSRLVLYFIALACAAGATGCQQGEPSLDEWTTSASQSISANDFVPRGTARDTRRDEESGSEDAGAVCGSACNVRLVTTLQFRPRLAVPAIATLPQPIRFGIPKLIPVTSGGADEGEADLIYQRTGEPAIHCGYRLGRRTKAMSFEGCSNGARPGSRHDGDSFRLEFDATRADRDDGGEIQLTLELEGGISGTNCATQCIGPAGGTLSLGPAELRILPGALTGETAITVQRRALAPAPSVDDTYEFGPSPLVFGRPALLTLNLGPGVAQATPDIERRRLAYIEHGRFEVLATQASFPSAAIFTAAVDHFSQLGTPAVQAVTTSYYPVSGNCSDLPSQFAFPDPSGPPAAGIGGANCQTILSHSDPTGSGRICETFHYTNMPVPWMQLPDWVDPCPICSLSWTAFSDALAAHEQGHVNIGVAGCNVLAQTLGGKDTTFCGANQASVEKQAQDAYAAAVEPFLTVIQQEQDQYDVETHHGPTLDCSCEKDFDDDPKNCGACGTECAPSQTCCNRACVDTRSDSNNCGACGAICGGCGNACSGQACCGGTCVSTQSDAMNCGGCGIVCGGCGSATCSGNSCCGAACIDAQSDPNNCGSCGHACQPGEACVSGRCQGDCRQPQNACDLSACLQCEPDPATGTFSCQSACAQGEGCCRGACQSGSCQPPPPPPPPGPGPQHWGDPHTTSWDGLHFNFQYVGEFLLVTDGANFVIQARQGPWPGSTSVATVIAVAARVGADRVGVYSGTPPVLKVNGVPSSSVLLASGGSASLTAITWPDGSRLAITPFATHLDLSLALASQPANPLTGIFGTPDGVPGNDLASRGGRTIYTLPLTTPDFANSWRIGQTESLFDYDPGTDTTTFTDLTFPHQVASTSTLDPATYAAAQATCLSAGVKNLAIEDDCILDVAVTGSSVFAQGAAAVVAPMSSLGAISSAAVAPDSGTVDRVGRGDNALAPDGLLDQSIMLTVQGPIYQLAIISTDGSGAPAGGDQNDTIVGSQPIPASIGTSFRFGYQTWVLGVYENGRLLNNPDGSIPLMSPGPHTLTAYFSPGAGFGTRHERPVAVLEDGTLSIGPVVAFP